jgi:FtsH-binding integral membrane protein
MARYKSPATRRYMFRVAGLMGCYLGALVGVSMAFRNGLVSGPLAYPLAILPALPVIGVFWAVMRLLIEEPDEYLRMLLVRQVMIATGFCLSVMTILEFLRNFDLLSSNSGGFGATFYWFGGFAIGAIYNRITAGSANGSC